MKQRTSSRSLVRQAHDRHPPRPAQCGKAIRKRSAIVSFTALPLVDAPRGRETPKGYFRPDLEQSAADELERVTLLPARMPSPPTLADLLDSTQERPPAATRCAATIANDLAQAVLVNQAQVLVEDHETCMV